MKLSRNSEDLMKAKYPKCIRSKTHGQEMLNLICLNADCKGKGLICSMCKSAQHAGHNVVPLKMVINKSDDLLRKKKQFMVDALEEARDIKADALLGTIEQAHIQNMYLLRRFVQQIAGQVMKCEEHLIKEFQRTKQSVLQQFNQESDLEAAVMGCSRTEDILELNLSVLRLLSIVKIGKSNPGFTEDQYSLESKLDEKMKKYHQIGNSFKKNIELINDDTMSLLNDIFEQKMLIRPSTAMTDRSMIGVKSDKYTFSSTCKPKGIVATDAKSAKQTDANTGKIVFVNENIGEKKQLIRLKINSVNGSVCFGVGLREVLKAKKFKFTPTQIGHGVFMLASNSYIYSHNEAKQNMTMKGFTMKSGEEIEVQLDGEQLKFKKKADSKTLSMSLKMLKQEDWKQLAFCVCLNSNSDKVSIV